MLRANGDADGVSTSTTRIRRDRTSAISSRRPATSYTSCRHSRMASSTTGNCSYFAATDSSCAERCRCRHSGVRLRGSRRGSSSERAAHSRNREANSAEPPTSATTICSTSSGSSRMSSARGVDLLAVDVDARPAAARTMPSSECATRASTPRRSRSRAPIASAHGALTCAPNGECTTSRQSPSSSRNRSTSSVRSSGMCRVASFCSARYASRLSAASTSSPAAVARSRAAGSGMLDISRRNLPSARPSSSGRPGASPFQNGIRAGSPGAGVAMTRSAVMSWIRHDDVPSRNVSPTRDS